MEMPFQNNSIFFVDVEKIKPNPFQPRIEFDDAQLESLSDSIRMYGVLQPLVVTRKEVFTEEGGMSAQYELIAGERRLRASKLAGLKEVPVVIRSAEQTDQEKLELAIIENLQREDLNPVDRAKAFKQLAEQFNLKHAEIGKRVGKSREYVSNSLRLLALPEEMLAALTVKKISEGHARSLLMLGDRPEEQMTLFKEIVLKGLTVRQAEKIARRVAYDKVRKKSRAIDPHVVEVEEEMSGALGTRVHIERKAVGGKIEIDFFSEDDLAKILDVLKQHEGEIAGEEKDPQAKMNNFIEQTGGLEAATGMILEQKKAEAEAQETSVEEQVIKQQADVQPQEISDVFSYDSIMARPNKQSEVQQSEEEIEQVVTQETPQTSNAQEDLVVNPESMQGVTHEDLPQKSAAETASATEQKQEPLTEITPSSQQASEQVDSQEEEMPTYGSSQEKAQPETQKESIATGNIQVQSIVENTKQPLVYGESLNNMAASHAEEHAKELYYDLPPQAQNTNLDAPIEVATPHYGEPQKGDDEHLYRV